MVVQEQPKQYGIRDEKTDRFATRVIFRYWHKKYLSQITAILLEDNWITPDGKFFVEMFETVGGHGGGDYQAVMSQTRPAQPHEYARAKECLESYGYDLTIVERFHDHQQQMEAAYKREREYQLKVKKGEL